MAWLSGWNYRKSHTINPASGAGTNYQVTITAHYGSGTDSGSDVYLNSHSRTDFGDVRFTASNGSTLLDYWIESKSDGVQAVFWVEISDDLSTNSATIYIYYGNSSATTTSNGGNTFLFFDDASTNKSSSYIFRDIHNSGQPGSLSYDGTNKRYTISWSSSDNIALVISGSNFNDAEIEIRFRTPSSLPSNFQFGAISRCVTTSGLYWMRANAATYPDTLQIYRGPAQPSTSETQLATTNYSGNVIASNSDYTLKARAWGSNLYCWTSLENKGVSATDSSYSSGEWGVFCAYDVSSVYFNFIKVRKYVSPEPTHGSWGSEETSGGQTYYQTCVETTSLNDAISKSISTIKTDGIGLSEQASRATAAVRGDTINLSELISKIIAILKQDNIITSDAIGKSISIKKSDIINLSEAISKIIAILKQDNIITSDIILKSVAIEKLDGITLNDLISKYIQFTKSDNITLSDSIITQLILQVILEDSLQLLDELKKSAGKNIQEIISLQESINKYLQIIRTEGITLSDAILTQLVLVLSLTDTINIGDAIVKNAFIKKQDTINLIESISKSTHITRSDAITLIDYLQKLIYLASLAEALSLAEAISKGTHKQIEETISLADVYEIFKILHIILEENITLDDTLIASFAVLLPFAIAIALKKLYESSNELKSLFDANIEFARG